MKLAWVLVGVGLAGFVVCVALAVYEHLRSKRKRQHDYKMKVKALEEGREDKCDTTTTTSSSSLYLTLFQSTLPDSQLTGRFDDADRVFMTKIMIHGMNICSGRWEDWFREADRRYLLHDASDDADGGKVGKLSQLIKAAVSGKQQDNQHLIDSLREVFIKAASRVDSEGAGVTVPTRLFVNDDAAGGGDKSSLSKLLAASQTLMERMESVLKGAIKTFPAIFILQPDWHTFVPEDEDAVNIVMTAPTELLARQQHIPTRTLLLSMMVAICDVDRQVCHVLDHQLAAYLKCKVANDSHNPQLTLLGQRVIPFIVSGGWRTQLPIVVDFISVWFHTDSGCSGVESGDGEELFEWFKGELSTLQ